MKNERRKKKRLLLILIYFFFTAILLSSSTYAWFTANRVVTVNTLNVHVAASGGIEISADGSNWKSIIQIEDLTNVHDTTYPTSVNQIPYLMEPVSTGKEIDSSTGFLKMFYGVTNNNLDGDYILTATRSVEEESNGEESTGKFIAFDLFFRVNKDTEIYLTTNSGATYQGDLDTGIANATRIAFVNEGTLPTGSSILDIQSLKNATTATTYFWEPNYDVHTDAAVSNAFDVYGITTTTTNGTAIPYDGVINEISANDNILLSNAKSSYYANLFKTVNIDYYTISDFSEFKKVFTLPNGITKVRVYMWIEGQDVDCENNASYGDLTFNVQFSVNPS